MADYHAYVFDIKERKFIGQFEEMYQAENEKGFDSWQQDDLRVLDVKVCLEVLTQYNFSKILDVGCGKGSFTQFLKKQNNSVCALDISETALQRARNRFPDIDFKQADLSSEHFHQIAGGGYDLITCLEVLSYIENWREVLQIFSKKANYILLKLYLPENPIGYIKSMDSLKQETEKYFEIIEDIRLVSHRKIILFAHSLQCSK